MGWRSGRRGCRTCPWLAMNRLKSVSSASSVRSLYVGILLLQYSSLLRIGWRMTLNLTWHGRWQSTNRTTMVRSRSHEIQHVATCLGCHDCTVLPWHLWWIKTYIFHQRLELWCKITIYRKTKQTQVRQLTRLASATVVQVCRTWLTSVEPVIDFSICDLGGWPIGWRSPKGEMTYYRPRSTILQNFSQIA